MSKSYLERITDALILEARLPLPITEYRFCEERGWKSDYVWLNPGWTQANDAIRGVILEIEGGVFMKKSRHTSGKGFTADCEKYNEATLLGFKVLRVTKYHLISGHAMEWVKRALKF